MIHHRKTFRRGCSNVDTDTFIYLFIFNAKVGVGIYVRDTRRESVNIGNNNDDDDDQDDKRVNRQITTTNDVESGGPCKYTRRIALS